MDGNSTREGVSQLRWIFGWGKRIKLALEAGTPSSPNAYLWYCPDREAERALLFFSASRYFETARQIDQILQVAHQRFDAFCASPTKDNGDYLMGTIERLARIVTAGAEAIAKAEGIVLDVPIAKSKLAARDRSKSSLAPPIAEADDKNGSPKPFDTLRKKTKKSTEKGDARKALIAALLAHHKYADQEDGGYNWAPIGNNELARAAGGVSQSSAKALFDKYFTSHANYKSCCRRNQNKVLNVLKVLNDDWTIEDTYGTVPPGEQDREDK